MFGISIQDTGDVTVLFVCLNGIYYLAGRIMEIAGGKSIFRLMRENLFGPLEVKYTLTLCPIWCVMISNKVLYFCSFSSRNRLVPARPGKRG